MRPTVSSMFCSRLPESTAPARECSKTQKSCSHWLNFCQRLLCEHVSVFNVQHKRLFSDSVVFYLNWPIILQHWRKRHPSIIYNQLALYSFKPRVLIIEKCLSCVKDQDPLLSTCLFWHKLARRNLFSNQITLTVIFSRLIGPNQAFQFISEQRHGQYLDDTHSILIDTRSSCHLSSCSVFIVYQTAFFQRQNAQLL